jgi:CBS domain containing-hemolysin-like protein
MSAAALIIILAVLVVGWLTAAGAAVQSVSRIWLRHWVEHRLGGSAVAEGYLVRPQRLIRAANAGTALTVALAGGVLGAVQGGRPARLVGSVVILVVALLLAGQLLPRAIARRWAPRLIPVLLPPLHAMAFLVGPLLRGARAVARMASPRRASAAETPREGIEDLLREGELEGIGEPEEIEIITGVVQFGEKVLRDVMTPRTDIFAVDIDLPPREMARAIARSGYSRIPVYRGSLDEIIGMVHVFDVLKVGGQRMPPIRELSQAPASKRCTQMLFEMLRRQQHMVIVLDEYGGTAGLVTLEDMLEELVGDIRDEHDEPAPPEQPPAMRAAIIDASTPLSAVAQRFGVELAPGGSDRTQSIGGLLVRQLGRIPALGEQFRMDELEIVVVDAEPSRARRLLVQRADSARPIELTPAR